MSSLSTALLDEVKVIVQQSPSAISSLVDAAKKGKWTQDDTNQLVALIEPLLSYLGDFNSVGILASGSLSFILSVEEVPGVVLNTQDITASPYFYNFVGGSIGFSEGAEAAIGILVAQGTPDSLSGLQVFADADITLVGGVGVQASAGGDQYMIFVSTGEEVNVSVGAGDVSVKQL